MNLFEKLWTRENFYEKHNDLVGCNVKAYYILKNFFQVKQYNAFRGEYNAEAFTFKNVSKKVLGQHGIKLVMEASESYFFPYVVGLLCIGTKVSILYFRLRSLIAHLKGHDHDFGQELFF